MFGPIKRRVELSCKVRKHRLHIFSSPLLLCFSIYFLFYSVRYQVRSKAPNLYVARHVTIRTLPRSAGGEAGLFETRVFHIRARYVHDVPVSGGTIYYKDIFDKQQTSWAGEVRRNDAELRRQDDNAQPFPVEKFSLTQNDENSSHRYHQ